MNKGAAEHHNPVQCILGASYMGSTVQLSSEQDALSSDTWTEQCGFDKGMRRWRHQLHKVASLSAARPWNKLPALCALKQQQHACTVVPPSRTENQISKETANSACQRGRKTEILLKPAVFLAQTMLPSDYTTPALFAPMLELTWNASPEFGIVFYIINAETMKQKTRFWFQSFQIEKAYAHSAKRPWRGVVPEKGVSGQRGGSPTKTKTTSTIRTEHDSFRPFRWPLLLMRSISLTANWRCVTFVWYQQWPSASLQAHAANSRKPKKTTKLNCLAPKSGYNIALARDCISRTFLHLCDVWQLMNKAADKKRDIPHRCQLGPDHFPRYLQDIIVWFQQNLEIRNSFSVPQTASSHCRHQCLTSRKRSAKTKGQMPYFLLCTTGLSRWSHIAFSNLLNGSWLSNVV